jgi:hypothetical protein
MDLANVVAFVTIFAEILCASGASFVNTEVYAFEGCGYGRAGCPVRPLMKECKSPEVVFNAQNWARAASGEDMDVFYGSLETQITRFLL